MTSAASGRCGPSPRWSWPRCMSGWRRAICCCVLRCKGAPRHRPSMWCSRRPWSAIPRPWPRRRRRPIPRRRSSHRRKSRSRRSPSRAKPWPSRSRSLRLIRSRSSWLSRIRCPRSLPRPSPRLRLRWRQSRHASMTSCCRRRRCPSRSRPNRRSRSRPRCPSASSANRSRRRKRRRRPRRSPHRRSRLRRRRAVRRASHLLPTLARTVSVRARGRQAGMPKWWRISAATSPIRPTAMAQAGPPSSMS